ncbi:MAG: hypothetical protein KGL53_13585, partial [Elusimicrobia bacterium]|nr:hypothetical protein [Elusimicrobiota bacterium]
MTRRQAGEALLLLALAAFAAAVCAVPILDPDTWWHLAAGRQILSLHAVPRAEAWSHTLRGAPWVDFEWLAQALLELVRRAGGFGALVWTKAAVCAAAVLAVYAAARREGTHPPGAALAALLALSAMRIRAQVRPELATLLFLPVFLLVIRERTRRPVPLWPLVLLSALWANLHGGWPLGPGLLLLAAAGR